MNLAENLDRTARARGRFAALSLGDEVTSFGEVDRWSRRVAGFLAGHGVRAGDRVGLVLPDVLEFAALYYGILRLGAVVVPMSPSLSEQDMHHRLRDSGARALVASATTREPAQSAARSLGVVRWVLGAGGLAELVGDASPLDSAEPRSADDVAVIVYTAGTTQQPRGAAITHGNLLRSCEAVVNDLLHLTSEDVVLSGCPLSHSFGQSAGLNAAVRAGACLILLAQLNPEAALETVRDRGVTVMEGSPALYDGMLHLARHHDHVLPRDQSRLRVCVAAGAAMPVKVLVGFEETFHCLVLEGYALAETPVASFNRVDRRRVGSIGVPVNGVQLRVVDALGSEVADGESGELAVRGPHVMSGYWGRPDETAAALVDGWLRTGDVGVKDEDGFFYVVDRVQEMVDQAASTVPPQENLNRAIRLETRA